MGCPPATFGSDHVSQSASVNGGNGAARRRCSQPQEAEHAMGHDSASIMKVVRDIRNGALVLPGIQRLQSAEER